MSLSTLAMILHHLDLPAGRLARPGTNRAPIPRRLVGACRIDTAAYAEQLARPGAGGLEGRCSFSYWPCGVTVLLPLKLYPVLVNAALLGVFAYSLISPPSMIERFARIREPDLPAGPLAILDG